MCTGAYDLVCDECRAKQDEIFGKLREKGDYTIDEETKAREEWFRSLCPECLQMLKEEGFTS